MLLLRARGYRASCEHAGRHACAVAFAGFMVVVGVFAHVRRQKMRVFRQQPLRRFAVGIRSTTTAIITMPRYMSGMSGMTHVARGSETNRRSRLYYIYPH